MPRTTIRLFGIRNNKRVWTCLHPRCHALRQAPYAQWRVDMFAPGADPTRTGNASGKRSMPV